MDTNQRISKIAFVTFCSIVVLVSSFEKVETTHVTTFSSMQKIPRGVSQGVSAKSNPPHLNEITYNWTSVMFSWQRTSFHFQPQKNWMNGMYSSVPYVPSNLVFL